MENEVVIYQTKDGKTKIDVKFENETVWLSQQQMAELFQSSRTNIVEHIKHIYEEGELLESATCRNFRQVQKEGNREVSREIPHYNLDMIISLGYRVKSDSEQPFMGLKTFTGDLPTKKDVVVAKNYLDEKELKALNNLVSAYFDIAELAALEHKPMHMADYVEQLDDVIKGAKRKVLETAGSISHKQAVDKALEEYRKYQVATLSPVEQAYLEAIKELEDRSTDAHGV